MKKLLILFFGVLLANAVTAQFTRASLQASGLTCAMCSRAIDNALKQLPFIESVKPDIKNSSFNIVFKPGVVADPDILKQVVEDAGFFVAGLKMTGNFNNVSVKNDEHVIIGGKAYHFINIKEQLLNGEKTLTIVDKNFLTAAAFKKLSNATGMQCLQTGKTAGCCEKAGVATGTRIYHVTI